MDISKTMFFINMALVLIAHLAGNGIISQGDLRIDCHVSDVAAGVLLLEYGDYRS